MEFLWSGYDCQNECSDSSHFIVFKTYYAKCLFPKSFPSITMHTQSTELHSECIMNVQFDTLQGILHNKRNMSRCDSDVLSLIQQEFAHGQNQLRPSRTVRKSLEDIPGYFSTFDSNPPTEQ